MKNTTVKIQDKNELVGFLRSIGTECRFVSLKTETAVKMKKTGNPFLGTVKVARRNGLVNINFVNSVNRKMTAAGIENPDYTAGSTWYVHESTTDGKPLPLCVHKKDGSKFYLQYYPHRNLETHYVLNGKTLTAEEVTKMKTFITEPEKNEFKPIVITLSMDSIRSIKFRRIQMLNDTISRIQKKFGMLVNEPAVTVNEPNQVAVCQ